MGTIITTLPQLSKNINAKQSQLIQSLNENTEFCKITSNHITQLQSHQTSTDVRIDQLEEIVSKLIHRTTPSSFGCTCKKSRQRIQEMIFSNKSDEDLSDHLPSTQLEMLFNNNTSTITPAIENTNTSIDMLHVMTQREDPNTS
jgi:hypothetical protein